MHEFNRFSLSELVIVWGCQCCDVQFLAASHAPLHCQDLSDPSLKALSHFNRMYKGYYGYNKFSNLKIIAFQARVELLACYKTAFYQIRFRSLLLHRSGHFKLGFKHLKDGLEVMPSTGAHSAWGQLEARCLLRKQHIPASAAQQHSLRLRVQFLSVAHTAQ